MLFYPVLPIHGQTGTASGSSVTARGPTGPGSISGPTDRDGPSPLPNRSRRRRRSRLFFYPIAQLWATTLSRRSPVSRPPDPEFRPRNGHTLDVIVVARISGGPNQKELSLDDQADHAREVIDEE